MWNKVIIEDLSPHCHFNARHSRVPMMHHLTHRHEEKLYGSEDIRTNTPGGFELTVTLTAIQYSQPTLQLMPMHHYTKFGYKNVKAYI